MYMALNDGLSINHCRRLLVVVCSCRIECRDLGGPIACPTFFPFLLTLRQGLNTYWINKPLTLISLASKIRAMLRRRHIAMFVAHLSLWGSAKLPWAQEEEELRQAS